LRRRLITEEEVVRAARTMHGPAAEKFVSEVFWRTYFKGYLETHPDIWTDYRRLVTEGERQLASSSGLRRTYERAVNGRTGIGGFDDWAREVVETGWLHNHARMWFASIWIFTLRLPWALGAQFFLRHLLDGDPASNTLSWRWVGGLHTRGKHYLARAENIRRYTDGRYDPVGLDERAEALTEPEGARLVPLGRADPAPAGAVALLVHLDDLHPESQPLDGATIVRIGGVIAHADGASERVRAADDAAMAEALARAGAHFRCPAALVAPGWADDLPVVTGWAPVGPSSEALPACSKVRRPWDEAAWPHSTRGFFQLRSAIPKVLRAAGLDED
ncbi:MAG TPA: FAD-binding domain-containing protein, partial [Methylobacterium sp.]